MKVHWMALVILLVLGACAKQAEPTEAATATAPEEVVAVVTEPNGCVHPVTTTGIIVTCVIDGDTFKLENGTKVRLIGVDTPERGQRGYENATSALVQLLNRSYVFFEKDVSDTDQYGRLLRYVYATDFMVNQVLVEQGWARATTYPPDTSKSKLFHAAQERAQQKKLGLWK